MFMPSFFVALFSLIKNNKLKINNLAKNQNLFFKKGAAY
jgi:hypothetical protein